MAIPVVVLVVETTTHIPTNQMYILLLLYYLLVCWITRNRMVGTVRFVDVSGPFRRWTGTVSHSLMSARQLCTTGALAAI